MIRLLQAIKSVSAAIIGIGGRKKLNQDLADIQSNGPWIYIMVALVMTAIFIGAVLLAVNLVLS